MHALRCSRGVSVIRRHDEIRDLTATLLCEVFHCVETESTLQSLTGGILNECTADRDEESRLDVKCKGFWNNNQDGFFDVRVYNPLVSSNMKLKSDVLFQKHEREKRRAYVQRVEEIEHGSFTPLVFSVTGALVNRQMYFTRGWLL